MFNNLKKLLKKGADFITGQNTELNSILDHSNVAMSESEQKRINRTWEIYRNNNEVETYKTSLGFEDKRDSKKSNVIKLVAKELITSIFNEGCNISVGKKDSTENKFLQEVFKNSTFNTSFANKLEYMFATGGLCVRPFYSSSRKRIELSWVLSNSFYPSEANTNSISSACIATKKTKTIGNKVYYYTLLEFHKWGEAKNPKTGEIETAYIIENEMYKSDSVSKVGSFVTLGTDEVNKNIEPCIYFFGFSTTMFTYFKPNNTNNKDPSSQLGMGMCDDCLGSVLAIQNTLLQLQREMSKGEPKIAVTQEMLQLTPITEQNKAGKLRFDNSTDVYSVFANGEFNEPKDLTLEIRPDEYIKILNTHLRMLERETGLTSGTFEIDGNGGLKTATEVMSENSQTYKTRNLQILTLNGAIKNLVLSIFQLAFAYDLYTGKMPEEKDINIDFSDGVFVSQESKEKSILERYSSGTLSLLRTIQRLENCSEEDAKTMLLEIEEEKKSNDPFANSINEANETLGADE